MEQRNHDAVLVTLADRNFIDQAKQLFSSVYWNAGWKGDYMLLAHEIPEKDLKWFRDKGILVKKCKPLSKGKIMRDRKSQLDKLYLFTLEFKRWKNVVFLDADIIVRSSLDKLAKVKRFSAVHDVAYPHLRDYFNIENPKEFQEKKFNLGTKTFFSGTMAFSTDIIKKDTSPKIENLIKKYIEISKFSDQSIINLLFYREWKRLPFTYSMLPIMISKDVEKCRKIKGVVLHFARLNEDSARSWNKKNPFYSEWKQNLDRANNIDLNNIPESKNKNNYIIESFLAILIWKFNEFLIKLRNFIRYEINPRIKNIFPRILGIIGQTIKKINPNLYYRLKNNQKEI